MTKMPKGKPFSAGDGHEDIARRGGINSGVSRRKAKQLKEQLEILLDADDGGRPMSASIAAALIDQARQGNTKAFEIIRDTIGQKPTEHIELTAPDFSALDAVVYGQEM